MAGEIASAFVRIRPNMTGFQAETESGVRSGFGGIGKIVAGAFAGIAVFDFAKSAIEGAASIQKSTEVIKSGFGGASKAVLDFNEKAAAKLGISAAAGETTAAKFSILFQNLHIGKAAAADMTLGFEKLAGSISAIKGVDPTNVLNSLTLAAAGNTRGLKQLGIVVDTTSIKTEAMKLHLISHTKDAITPAIKAQAIYALATQNLGKFQAEAAKHAGDLTNQQFKLRAEFSNAKDQIGTALLPAMTSLVTMLANVLPGAMHVLQSTVGSVIDLIKTAVTGLAPIFDPFKDAIKLVVDEMHKGVSPVQALKDGFNSLGPLAKIAAVALGALAIALAATVAAALPITSVVIGIIALAEGFKYAYEHSQKFRDIVNEVVAFLEARVLPVVQTMAAGIVTEFGKILAFAQSVWPQIETVIGGVITVIEALWRRFGGTIETIIRNDFEMVKTVIVNTISVIEGVIRLFLDLLTGKWGKAWDDVKQIVSGTLNIIVAVIRGMVGNIAAVAEALGRAIWDGIKAEGARLPGQLLALIKGAFSALSGLEGWIFGEAEALGKSILDGIISGVGDLGSSLLNKAKSELGGFFSGVGHFIKKGSPSQMAAEEIGSPIGEGVIAGFLTGIAPLPATVKGKLKAALDAGRQTVQSEQSAFSAAFSSLGSAAASALDAVLGKIKTPAEVLLEKMQRQDVVAQLKQAVTDANQAIIDAQNQITQAQNAIAATVVGGGPIGGTPEEQKALADAQAALVDAEKQKNAALRAVREDDLAQKAARQRAALDDENALKKLKFQEALTALEKSLEREGATHQEAHARILKLFKKFGIDYRTSGAALGEALAAGLRDALPSVEAAAAALAKTIADYIHIKSPTEKGPMSTLDTWWTKLPETLLGGIPYGGLQRALDQAITPRGAPVAGLGTGAFGGSDTLVQAILTELRKQTDLAKQQKEIQIQLTAGANPNQIAAEAIR